MFSSKELAVVANVGSLVQPLTRAQYQAQQAPVPLNLFSHSDQQLQWQTSVAQGNSPTGWAGRVADYIAAQKINASTFPGVLLGGRQRAARRRRQHSAGGAWRPGRSLQLAGFNTTAASQARWSALNNLLTLDSGVTLAQAANNTLANSIARREAR